MGLLEKSFCRKTEGLLAGCCQETEGPLNGCCQEREGPLAGCSSALQFSPLKRYMVRLTQLSWQLCIVEFHFSGLRRIPLWKSMDLPAAG